MTGAELKAIVDQATPEDRIFLQAYLDHLARAADPESGRDLDRRLEEMRSGNEVSLDDIRRLLKI